MKLFHVFLGHNDIFDHIYCTEYGNLLNIYYHVEMLML